MVPPIPPEASKEIEFIKGLVARRFPVYDVRVTYDVVEFFVRTDSATLEQNFDELREEMAQHNYIPMIVYDKGEHIITVAKKPTTRYRSTNVNLVMLAITLLTTIIAGTIEWGGFENVPNKDIFALKTILMGTLTFALPLMAILGVHELSHYFAARRRKVAASLPFFIPSIPPLGTFGAFISLRDPIPNKKTLLEIGVAGPLAGFLLTIPIGILGLILTNDAAKLAPANVPSGGALGVVFPLMYNGLEYLVPLKGDFLIHPTAFAAWVGFLVTALNLLPVGQLDGGHVARALLGPNAKYLSWATIGVLIVLGLSTVYIGWLLFAMIILFLGVRHPPPLNDMTKLDLKRKALGVATFVVLIIAFVPIPLISLSPTYTFEMTNAGSTNAALAPGESHTFSVLVNNTGNAFNDIEFSVDTAPYGWSVEFKEYHQNDSAFAPKYMVGLNSSQNTTINVHVQSPSASAFGINTTISIKGISQNSTSTVRIVTYNLTTLSPGFDFWIVNDGLTIAPDTWGNVTVQVNNTGPAETNFTLNLNGTQPYVTPWLVVGGQNSTGPLNITVPGQSNSTFYVRVYVSPSPPATAGTKTVLIDALYHGAKLQTLAVSINVS
jgi:membrane-associated protease RseP (regulator of RpoE activity)